MSQSGQVVFFIEREPKDPIAIVNRILNLTGSAKYCLAWKTVEDNSWEQFKAGLDNPYLPALNLDKRLNLFDLPGEYALGTTLTIDIGSCPLASRVHQAILDGISHEVAGEFCTGQLTIQFGYHDLFECAEHPEGFYFGRAFLSLSFFGYLTPNDWEAFREAVFHLPEIQALRGELEGIIGPWRQCVYWNI